jgi:DNA-binding PadR family transcriptional regulator
VDTLAQVKSSHDQILDKRMNQVIISVTDISAADMFPQSCKDVTMSEAKNSPEDMLPLTPAVFHILLALADGEKHGYAIMQEVEAISAGSVNMGAGTLYGSIKRMLKAGLIEESDERPDPAMDQQQRRYYRLSELGERVLKAESFRIEALVRAIRNKNILGGT